MQIEWLSKSILIGKTDMDTEYRRIHANSHITSICIAIADNLALLCNRLNFGTAPTPAEYTTVIKVAIDLINDLLRKN